MVRGCLSIHPQLEATRTFRDFRLVMFNNNCSKITICRRTCSMEGRDPSTVLVSHNGIANFFYSAESLADWENLGKVVES